MGLSIFVSTFALIFVAELPDKTAFAALFLATCHNPLAVFIGATAALAAKYHAPLTIFTSATLALWTVTAIGVIIGSQMKHRIQPQLLQRVAASAFAVVGIGMLVKA